MIVKLVDQFPLHGKHCFFHLSDQTTIEGHWEHGGVYGWPFIVVYSKTMADIKYKDFDKVLTWEYKDK